MTSNVHYIDEQTHTRPLSSTVNEAKVEFQRFAQTRVAMLQAEMKEKVATLKASAPMLVVGGLLAITAFWVLTAALISLLYVAFAGSPYATFWSCVIVGIVYAVIGGGGLLFGYQNIRKGGLVPERTIKVLKEDRLWFENEVKNRS